MKDKVLEQLGVFDSPLFKFDPKYHKYTYEGEKFISVTTIIGKLHEPFDSDFWSKKKAEETGVTQTEKLAEWQALNDYANEVGNGLHNWVENYFNHILQPLPNSFSDHGMDVIDRINKFNLVYGSHLHKLTPIKFEQMTFCPKWKIAGMIDSIFIYKDSVFILDWKTNKEFLTNDDKKGQWEKLLSPFDEHWKNHLTEYSIQISLYALILEEMCGIKIKTGYLCHIGPNTPAKMHQIIDMRPKLREFLGSDEYWELIK